MKHYILIYFRLKYLLGRTKTQQVLTWIIKHSTQKKLRLQSCCNSEEHFEQIFSVCSILSANDSSLHSAKSIRHHRLVSSENDAKVENGHKAFAFSRWWFALWLRIISLKIKSVLFCLFPTRIQMNCILI